MTILRPIFGAAIVVAAMLASPALTQPSSGGTTSLTADLDRDGRAETFQLRDNGESLTTLIIKALGKPEIRARDIAWSLERATLSRAPNGSILLNTSHIGVGRSPHEQTLTIAYRGGAYQVVGLTRSHWDRIDQDLSTKCDINLLTGRGKVNNVSVRRSTQGVPVTRWAWDRDLPAGCFIP